MAQGPRPRVLTDTQTSLRGLLAVPQSSGGGLLSANSAPPQAPRPRERVSFLRALDGIFSSEGDGTISGSIDRERARLQAEADRPQMMARQEANRAAAAQMGPAALIAFDNDPDGFAESLGMQYRPVTTAAGSRTTYGPGSGAFAVEQPTFDVSGDQTLRRDSTGVAPVYTRTAPSIKEGIDQQEANTKQYSAERPILGPNTRQFNPDGSVRAEGYIAPDIQNLAPGGTALVFDPQGNVTNSVASTQERPVNPAVMKRADDLELALTADENSIARVESALALITDPDGSSGPGRAPVRVGPLENFGASFMNATGQSNANSLGIAQLITTAESLRQGILNDATGPQTEGDALRALNSILAGRNDPAVIRQGFNDYLTAKRRTAAVRRRQMEDLRAGAGGQSAPAAASGSVVTARTPAEAQALRPGTRYRTPDGQEYVR
jgi:hypothetical protein